MQVSLVAVLVWVMTLAAVLPCAQGQGLDEEYPMLARVLRTLLDNPQILGDALGRVAEAELAQNFTRSLTDALERLQDNPEGKYCALCKVTFLGARALLRNSSWDELRGTTVSVCRLVVRLSEGRDYRTKELCNAMMDLYGPHVHPILTKELLLPKKICRNLNVCYNVRKTNGINGRSVEQVPDHYTTVDDVNNTDVNTGNDSSTSRVIRFIQLADIHVDPFYAKGSPVDCGLPTCCRADNEGSGSAGEFGTYTCNLPQRTLEAFLQQVTEIDRRPDFLVYTGDNPPHQMWDNETLSKQLHCTDIIMDSLAHVMSDVNVFCAMGNHEPHPTNLYYLGKDKFVLPESQKVNENLAGHWSKLANLSATEVETILEGAYYTAPTGVPGLRVIVVNGNLWYAMNFYTILADGSLQMRMMQRFITDSLRNARRNNEKVIMTIHHPPGQADFVTSYSQWYSDVMVEYSDIIVMHIAGHTHNDDFKVFTSASGEPVDVLYIAPSVTTRSGKGGVNPSARVFDLDPVTFELLDYHQYRMTLDPDAPEMPQLQYVYSARSAYKLTDMSGSSFMDLAHRLETDEELYERFDGNFRSHAPRLPCDATCKVGRLCAKRHTSYEEVVACQQQATSQTTTVATTTTSKTTFQNSSAHVTTSSGLLLVSLVTMVASTISFSS